MAVCLSVSSTNESPWSGSFVAGDLHSPTPFAPHGGTGLRCLRSIHSARFFSKTGPFGSTKLGILIALTSLHCLWKEVRHGGYHDSQGIGQVSKNEGGHDLSVCSGGETARHQNQRPVAFRQKQDRPDAQPKLRRTHVNGVLKPLTGPIYRLM